MIGFFVGRFQPFHDAHLQIIRNALKEVDKIIIGVGSSQYSNTAENPFTYEERKEMIGLALQEEGITPEKFEVVAVPDIHNHDGWVKHVESLCPKFEVIFTKNSLTKKLFEKEGYKVIFVPRIVGHSGTDIRERMANDDDWDFLVPKAVAEYLEKIGASGRIKESYQQ